MSITVQLPNIQNVVAGSTATLGCPVNRTYEKIMFTFAGVTLAQLKNIELQLNGKPIQRYKDGQQLVDLNNYHGRPDESGNGKLTLFFARPEMNERWRKLTALGTLDVNTMNIRIDIDGAAAAPALTALAVLSPPSNLNFVTKIRSFSEAAAVAGLLEVDSIPTGPRVLAAHFFKADVNDVKVELNSVKVYDATKADGEALQREEGKAPVTAKATHVDFTVNGDVAEAMVTQGVQDLRYLLTIGAPGSIDMVYEFLDGFAGI